MFWSSQRVPCQTRLKERGLSCAIYGFSPNTILKENIIQSRNSNAKAIPSHPILIRRRWLLAVEMNLAKVDKIILNPLWHVPLIVTIPSDRKMQTTTISYYATYLDWNVELFWNSRRSSFGSDHVHIKCVHITPRAAIRKVWWWRLSGSSHRFGVPQQNKVEFSILLAFLSAVDSSAVLLTTSATHKVESWLPARIFSMNLKVSFRGMGIQLTNTLKWHFE